MYNKGSYGLAVIARLFTDRCLLLSQIGFLFIFEQMLQFSVWQHLFLFCLSLFDYPISQAEEGNIEYKVSKNLVLCFGFL